MKTFIIVALSADGFIAKDLTESSLSWTSKADKEHFVTLTKKAGVVVMGAKTFSTIGKALSDRRTIVYSMEKIDSPGIETCSIPPKELIEKLEKEGVEELAICGGASIYTMFMQSGLIDEIFITIEPVIFGDGLNLFKEKINGKLELMTLEKIDNSTFIRFKVKK